MTTIDTDGQSAPSSPNEHAVCEHGSDCEDETVDASHGNMIVYMHACHDVYVYILDGFF